MFYLLPKLTNKIQYLSFSRIGSIWGNDLIHDIFTQKNKAAASAVLYQTTEIDISEKISKYEHTKHRGGQKLRLEKY